MNTTTLRNYLNIIPMAIACLLIFPLQIVHADANQELEALARAFSQAANERDIDKMTELMDIRALGYKIAKSIYTKQSEIDGFVKGFTKRGEKVIVQNLFTPSFQKNMRAKYIRIINDKGSPRPLVRIDYPESGHDYMILNTSRKKSSNRRITDVFVMSRGKKMSDSMGSATRLFMAPSKSIIKKILGIKEIDKSIVNQFKTMSQHIREGKYLQAYEVIQGLPKEIQNSRVIIDMSVQVAQSISNDEYLRQLRRLNKYHGDDDTTSFMLIDYYFMIEDYKGAMNSVDKVIKKLGQDGALYNLKANIAFSIKDYPTAEKLALEAIKVEPDFEDGYWSLVSTLIQSRQFDKVVKALKTIEKNFHYSFNAENFISDDFYSEFVKSQAFKHWLN